LAGLAATSVPGTAQESNEAPLALVLAASGAHTLRAGSDLPLSAKPGDILFLGDALRSDGGTVTFLSCAGNTQQTLSPDGDVLFESRAMKLRAGRFSGQKAVAGCHLPAMPRSFVASQQDAGAAVARQTRLATAPGTFEQRVQALPETERAQLMANLPPADPNDPLNRLARAAVLENNGLKIDAAEEMRQVAAAWPDAGWARSRLFVLEQGSKGVNATEPPPEAEGQTYALLVGISKFQDERINPLEFADQDAIELTRLIESPRAGNVPPPNLILLTNQQATRAAIQSAIETHLKARAGKNDTVLLFIASHGATYPVDGKQKGFIVTYDSNPEDLSASGIPMDDVHKLFENQLTSVKRLLLYVDVCHAGKIGQIVPRFDAVNKTAERDLTSEDVQMFGILAAQGGQVAIEGVDFGGGHGAFTYFLMRALNGDADLNRDGKVTMSELSDYVHDKVQEATARRQTPKQIGDIDETRTMAVTTQPGIDLKEYTVPTLVARRSLTQQRKGPSPPAVERVVLPLTASTLKYQDPEGLIKRFEDAVQQGHILPADDPSAFTFLDALSVRLKPEEYRAEAEKLRVALEDRGQQVLLTYLAGEQTPQKRDDFQLGRAYFEAARNLTPDSVYLESRLTFCQGRVAIFDKDYQRAETLLARAVGLDPELGYSYNGLGIAYLERADYDRAILAFRDAAKRAPYWAYPLHNMALALAEKGDYAGAIRTYERAIEIAPHVFYLPYNLGLLYQRLNRSADAEASYRKAMTIDPGNARAWNALGSLKAAAGRNAGAEKYYRQALERDPQFLAARYNLALLLSASKARSGEAQALWRDNLSRDPEHLPSRLSLAQSLAQSGNDAEAAREYGLVVAARPDYVAARLALGDIDTRMGNPSDALGQFEQAFKIQPASAEILEKIAQGEAALGRTADARSAYEKALPLATDGGARKRIRAALEKLK